MVAMALDGVSREEAVRQVGMGWQQLRDWFVRHNAEGGNGSRDRVRIAARCCRPPLPTSSGAVSSNIGSGISASCALRYFGAERNRTGM